jgi:hypothetical protein
MFRIVRPAVDWYYNYHKYYTAVQALVPELLSRPFSKVAVTTASRS